MRTRQQLINQIIRDHEAAVGGPDAYSTMIRAKLEKRLTEATYLTCETFDHFDLQCCTTCHGEPHFEMADVVLADDRHAWVCCHVRDILIRQTKKPPSPDPDRQKVSALLADMFGQKPDPVADELHAANLAATSDEERLYYCLKYAHHKSGRKRGHKKLETIVQRARRLPGGRPAKGCTQSEPPESCGVCLLCGSLIFVENMIPGTQFHNCQTGRELRRKDRRTDTTDASD